MFTTFLDKIRDITNSKTKIVDKNGNEITEANLSELKKSELEEYIFLLEADREVQRGVLNNLDGLKKSFSEDLYNDAENTTLSKIVGIEEAIEKAKKGLVDLKNKFADAIIYNNKGEILFLLRSSNSSFEPGKLGLPGGHIDKGEKPEEAVKREVEEETNYKVKSCQLVGELKNRDVEISYFTCQLDTEDEVLILDNSEHFNYKWLSLDDLKEEEAIKGLKDKLEELLNPTNHAVKILKKAFEQDLITEEKFLEALSKAKGVAQVGEIREWSGQKMQKTAQGWIPVKGDKKAKQEEQPKEKKDKKQEPQKNGVEKTPEQLSAHAKEASTEGLQKVAEDKNSDPSLQEAANQELADRGVESSPKQKLKEKAKDWHKKQVEFYQSGALDSGSEDRKGLSNFLAKKKDGIVKAIKDEGQELKAVGTGLKKFFSGNKAEITEHEKKAIKTTAIHLGIVIGSMALTGGLGGLATKGMAALGKGVVAHYFEHAGLMRLGHVLAFAKAEGEELSDEELDKILGKLIDEILAYIESGDISEEEWLKIGDESSDEFETLNSEEGDTEEEDFGEEEKETSDEEGKGKKKEEVKKSEGKIKFGR